MFVWYMRMQGAKVGKNCCVMGGFCTEWDLLTIGDNSGGWVVVVVGRAGGRPGGRTHPVHAVTALAVPSSSAPAVADPRPRRSPPPCLPAAVVGDQAFFMGHTVEHRCVKMGPVTLGKRVTVGTLSAVLPGAVLEDGCTIGDVSLVMKQELVPAGAGVRAGWAWAWAWAAAGLGRQRRVGSCRQS